MYTIDQQDIDTHAYSPSGEWEPIPYLVKDKIYENERLISLVLEPAGEKTIAPILPGQFNMLYVFGVGEIPISVSSVEEAHPIIVHTTQAVGPISMAICKLEPGDLLGVRGPYGTQWPIKEAFYKDVLIIAGGVGLCPLRPVIERFLQQRKKIGNLNVLYGARDPESIIFHNDIISWQSDPHTNFQVTVDHAFSKWHGHVGVVTRLINRARFEPTNTLVYVCGPEVMMRFAIFACQQAGIPDPAIYCSMERNMKCGFGLCGHCQYGPHFVCKDGAVFNYEQVKPYLNIQDL